MKTQENMAFLLNLWAVGRSVGGKTTGGSDKTQQNQ
jgi:hypothetical protein